MWRKDYHIMGFLEDHNITGFEYPPETRIGIVISECFGHGIISRAR